MFIKDLLHARHCSPVVTGLYLQILPVSQINTIHWKYSRWVCVCVLFCVFIMFSFIRWLNYTFWRKKTHETLPLSTQVNGLLPGLSHCGTEPRSRGPVHLPRGCGQQKLYSVTGLHFSDSSSQPHHHTTHLNSQFLEMTVSERFIVGTNSQQN